MHLRLQLCGVGVLLAALAMTAFAQKPAGPGHPPARRVPMFGPAFPTRPPADPAVVAHGKQLFETNCSFCHGSDARGGETGPNLVRSQLVLDDQHGELMTPVVQNGRPGLGMPKFALSAPDITAIAAFLHAQPLSDRGAPSRLDILVGNAAAGKTYFDGAGKCSSCHSVSGDMAGIGGKFDPKTLQNLIVSGGGGRSFGPRAASMPKVPPTTVTVTLASGKTYTGKLDRLNAFIVALTEPSGDYRSFARNGDSPRVVVHNPLQAHIDMLPRWNDTDIHNLTAYLVTVK